MRWLFIRMVSKSKWDLWVFCQIIRCWVQQTYLLLGLPFIRIKMRRSFDFQPIRSRLSPNGVSPTQGWALISVFQTDNWFGNCFSQKPRLKFVRESLIFWLKFSSSYRSWDLYAFDIFEVSRQFTRRAPLKRRNFLIQTRHDLSQSPPGWNKSSFWIKIFYRKNTWIGLLYIIKSSFIRGCNLDNEVFTNFVKIQIKVFPGMSLFRRKDFIKNPSEKDCSRESAFRIMIKLFFFRFYQFRNYIN